MRVLRCSPCFGHCLLQEHDTVLREGISAIVNIHISYLQWLQASIPVKSGGLGFQRTASLALATLLASAEATSDLQSANLLRGGQNVDNKVELARSLWCSLGHLKTSQRARNAPIVACDVWTLLGNATSDIGEARLLAFKADDGSEWIYALPISACDIRISNEAVRIAIGLRLGLNLCEHHSCPCGGAVDAKGLHGLSCKRSAGRSIGHQQINDLVWRALRRAYTKKEPSELLPGDDKRLYRWY